MPKSAKPCRSAILRAAHAATRLRMQPTTVFNYSLDWCSTRRMSVQPLSYRQVLAQEMKRAWDNSRPIEPVSDRYLTEAEAAEVAMIRYLAWTEPFTAAGAAAFTAAQAQARAIEDTARARRAA